MNKIIKKIKDAGINYESGSMMREDSEVEIILLAETDICLADYSETRGSAEVVSTICKASEISAKKVIALCDKMGWAYSGF